MTQSEEFSKPALFAAKEDRVTQSPILDYKTGGPGVGGGESPSLTNNACLQEKSFQRQSPWQRRWRTGQRR